MAVWNVANSNCPEDGVNIMRPGRWGNPFTVEKYGRVEAVRLYKRWLWERIQTGDLKLEDLAALYGRNLICCCKPEACHGDVLEAAASWAYARTHMRLELQS